MKNYFRLFKNAHYIKVKGGLINEVSDSFCEFSQYCIDEIVGKEINYFFKTLLCISVGLKDLDSEQEICLFTKYLEVRFIYIHRLIDNNQIIYLIHERPDSRFNEKNYSLEKLITDNLVGVGVYTALDLMLIKANQTYLNYLPKPYNIKEIVYGRCIHEFIDGFNVSIGQKKWNEIIENNKSLILCEEKGLILDDGRFWDNTLIPVAENGKVKYIVSILNDVTERVLSREKIEYQAKMIKDQNNKLEVIFQNISDGLAVIDKNRNYILQNDVYKSIMSEAGYSYVGLNEYEKSFYINGSLTSYEKLPIFNVLKSKRVVNERILVKKGPHEQHVDLAAIPILDDNGEFDYGIITARDITAFIDSQTVLTKMNNDLLEAEKAKNEVLETSMNDKDEFLSLISHEFKTPLTVINSAIQTMEILCKNELSPKAMKYLSRIRQNSYRQLRLVNNLLDITKINSGSNKLNKKNIDIVFLTKAITDSVQLFAIQRGIDLSFTTNFSRKIIGIDDEKYERILLNLLSNAIKFTPAGKSVNVHLKMKKEFISLTVRDTGIGIPKEKQELIFNRFGQVDSTLRRSSEGTGLGLTLVKNIVNTLGGTISVDSDFGVGSTFTVLLPKDKVYKDVLFETSDNIADHRLINEIAVEFSDIYVDNFTVVENESSNLHVKIQNLLEREAILKAICSELSDFTDLKNTLNSVISHLKKLVKCEAIGIRLYKDENYPYFVYQGFSDSFIKPENCFCTNHKCCDKPILECICGRVISGEINRNLSFYSNKGSYWTNHASLLGTLLDDGKNLGSLRWTCIKSGYESMALIPIKSNGKTIGLIHINDSKKDVFSSDTIEFLEILGGHIGMAVELCFLHKANKGFA